MTDTTGLPPIEVYQIGEVFFIHDGHHRVSITRQGIDQQIPCPPAYPAMPTADGQVVSFPVLSGLHRDYQRRAA